MNDWPKTNRRCLRCELEWKGNDWDLLEPCPRCKEINHKGPSIQKTYTIEWPEHLGTDFISRVLSPFAVAKEQRNEGPSLVPPLGVHIIGFAGAAYSGKTTAAKLIGDPYVIHSLATPVKKIAREFGWDGKKDARGRRLLQVIGTEAGRAYDPDIWIKKWNLNRPEYCIVDDIRFDNEVEAIHARKGIVIIITATDEIRSSRAKQKGESLPTRHASEETISNPDYIICNNGTVEDLNAKLLAKGLWRKHD